MDEKAHSIVIPVKGLPREGKTVGDVLQTLNAESWERFRRMGEAIVDVKLPRFESNSDVNLKSLMSDLGMPRAFTDSAEFPNFCNVPTFISMMKQVARIKLDEEGTEAAAVTVAEMTVTAMPSEPQHLPRQPPLPLRHQRALHRHHLLHRSVLRRLSPTKSQYHTKRRGTEDSTPCLCAYV